MLWNGFLAFIPLVLSIWLFRGRGSRSILWWVGFATFMAFLPNAPYVLTDIIHLVHNIRWVESIWIIILVLVPQYLIFMLSGFQAYVISLINLGYYLQQRGLQRLIVATEILIHGLCAIGIYLGRFPRFNSWDILTKPDTLVVGAIDQLLGKRPLLIVAITFVIITVLYWLFKQMTLALIFYWQQTRQKVKMVKPVSSF
jgi:uncharacterized membrane protein